LSKSSPTLYRSSGIVLVIVLNMCCVFYPVVLKGIGILFSL